MPLQNLSPEKCKTRYALKYLLSERAILEACAAHWEELWVIIGEMLGVGLDESDSDSD